MPAAVFTFVVVMPLVADCVPLGKVKLIVLPGLRLMSPRFKSYAFELAAVKTMDEQPGLSVRE